MHSLTLPELERLRDALQATRKRLAADLRTRLHANGADLPAGLRRYLSDEMDAADAAEQLYDDLASLDHDAGDLRRVDAALRRLAEGRYGICACCGVAIPLGRLSAMPTAERCLACQRQAELAHHADAHPASP